ncbi:hypothetical protein [Leucobacter aridicollis]|uniref:Uncharacterized protein n=1 Tax=Leucobacter aridicollis TaxID=283878 RepID=A0A852QZY3_9MICO|nr:hypothetical protein [Leucobacter aridicollis]MBL3682022.1 hypothetical protein [Leucobacter aridicollis]NYD26931.1 hypothetical protein [Leucobacter aridicollis]
MTSTELNLCQAATLLGATATLERWSSETGLNLRELDAWLDAPPTDYPAHDLVVLAEVADCAAWLAGSAAC